ncbi:O-antigen ligase [Hydrogenophaga palleronii]|uniref:O-antigen ligase n=1 Tax=Hydrogenophaga palleronii TaxID=65655 RepID=A0ABU1WG87_9BURK|nr:O-antigen ligase family protein [Hydrogenophaga palleronii]MDR7148285.1 O-antigen ligase [Hydrogenophaga palleronii]
MNSGSPDTRPRALLTIASAYCLVLVYFAFPMSVALANTTLALAVLLAGVRLSDAQARADLVRTLRNPVVWPAMGLVLVMVVATLWSPADWSEYQDYLRKYFKLVLLPIFLMLLADAEVRKRCWQAFAVAMLFTLVSTWLNVWFDLPWSSTQNQGFGVDHTVFKDHISQGIMMAFFTCATLFWATKSASAVGRVLWTSVAVLAAASVLFLSVGRTGYLSLVLSVLVFFVVALACRPRLLGAVLGAGLLGLVLALALSSQFQQRTLQAWEEAKSSSPSNVTSVGARVQVWYFAVQQIRERPLLGAGTGSYPVLATAHFENPAMCATICPHPHNQFLFFLFELGLLGLLVFAWFLWAIVRQAFRHPPAHRALMLAFVAVMLVSNMTHSSFWLSTESHFFILFTALLMASALRSVEQEKATSD